MTAAVAMEIPMVHKVERKFFERVKNGMKVSLDADNGVITVCTEAEE